MAERRRGFSLIETVVGVAVAAATFFPVVVYFLTLQMAGQTDELETEAITMASNIMETILSRDVKFSSIVPGGAPDLARARNGTAQASISPESILSDEVRDGERIKRTAKSVAFRTYLFAGLYRASGPRVDRLAGTRAAVRDELTFSHLQSPIGDLGASFFWRGSAANDRVVLPAAATLPSIRNAKLDPSPYRLVPHLSVDGNRSWTDMTARLDESWNWRSTNPYRIPGWPSEAIADEAGRPTYVVRDPGQGVDRRHALRKALYECASGLRTPTWRYHPITTNQATVVAEGKPRDCLMKIVVGVRYRLHGFHSAGSAAGEKEFWLASLKARLEE